MDTEYVNDVVSRSVHIRVQGIDFEVDPDKFTLRDEILIRQAFKDESDVLRDMDVSNSNDKILRARDIILDCAETIIPKVSGLNKESIIDSFSLQSIGAILSFFLGSDWRKVEIETVDRPRRILAPASLTAIPESHSKKTSTHK